ncbi:MAG: AAA family ATPase [Deltaproteobacteria bacterium]|nr:AAA family ATPase [Deltaproteobacteria bacterium]
MSLDLHIESVTVAGYRVLEQTTFDLAGLSVLIGANASGKSTLLDLFVLLAEAMRGGLSKAISARGGIARLLSQGYAGNLAVRIESSPVGWPGSTLGSPLSYELEIAPSGIGYAITGESLSQDRQHPSGNPFRFLERHPGHLKFHDPATGNLVDPSWPVKHEEAVLAQVPRTYAAPESFRELLASLLHSAPVVLDERSALRWPQTLQPPEGAPSASGSDLVSVLYQMRAGDDDRWEQLTDVLSAGFPRFRKLEFPLSAGGQAALAWYEKDAATPLYANELSTGTLRFLHLAAILLSRNLPGLVLFDEPELSLHPELLRLLAELLAQAADEVQVVVATHSGALVRWMKPAQVVVTERDDEGCHLIRGDKLDLGHWLENYTLDQVWQLGLMGGKP